MCNCRRRKCCCLYNPCNDDDKHLYETLCNNMTCNNNNYNNIYNNWDQLDWNDENIKKLIDGLFIGFRINSRGSENKWHRVRRNSRVSLYYILFHLLTQQV